MTFDPNVLATVSSEALAVLAKNLGTPLHAARGLPAGFTERTRSYSSVTAANNDDDLSQAAKDAVAQHFSQRLYAKAVKVGRVDDDAAQQVTWTVQAGPATNDEYEITWNSIVTPYVAGATPTPDSVATGLRSALTTALAAEPVTVSGSAADVIITADNDGEEYTYSSSYTATGGGTSGLTEVETQQAVDIALEIIRILAADSDWYALTIDSRVTQDILDAAATVEAVNRIFMAQSSDADILTGTAGNVLLQLKALNYRRTALDYHHVDTELLDVGWVSYKSEANPDIKTTGWAYTPVSGVAKRDPIITDTEQNNVENNNGNLFTLFGGLDVAGMGVMVNGTPIDQVVTDDWTKARLEEAGKQLLADKSAANSKIEYTDKGGAEFLAPLDVVMKIGERVAHFEAGSTTLSVVPLAETPANIKAERKFLINASGVYAGTAERADIQVSLQTA